jgi:hypothetical protein
LSGSSLLDFASAFDCDCLRERAAVTAFSNLCKGDTQKPSAPSAPAGPARALRQRAACGASVETVRTAQARSVNRSVSRSRASIPFRISKWRGATFPADGLGLETPVRWLNSSKNHEQPRWSIRTFGQGDILYRRMSCPSEMSGKRGLGGRGGHCPKCPKCPTAH